MVGPAGNHAAEDTGRSTAHATLQAGDHTGDHTGGGPAGQRTGHAAQQGDGRRENAVLRELVTVYRHLSGLALQHADVGTVAQLLAERLTATVSVVSPAMDVLAAAGPDGEPERAAERVRQAMAHPRLGQVLSTTAQARRVLRMPELDEGRATIVAPILVGDDVPAYLLTLNERGTGEDVGLLLTEHAATICGVILGRERVVAASARAVRDDLVEGLILGREVDEGEVQRWAQHLGYDAALTHRVLSVSFDISGLADTPDAAVARRQRVADAVDDFFRHRVPEVITSIRDTEVVVVLPVPGARSPSLPGLHQLSGSCITRVREQFPDAVVTVGMGGACREPAQIARSYAEARRTINVVRRLGRQGSVVAFDDLGIHQLLLQVPDLAELRSFAAGVLGRLDSEEPGRRAEYLTTLGCYFRENNSPQRASRILHLHPNTVAYRIRRIEEITGLRFERYRDRLMAQVALEIQDALGDST
ncbi:MAG: PucR family transcriptional regulator [Carbonactinosporaceae bacterium]